MIDISGHLRDYRSDLGFLNQEVPLEINCCGQQEFITQDFYKSRTSGRFDYQLLYIANGTGTFTMDGRKKKFGSGNIILYAPHEPQIYSYSHQERTAVYWIHFTGQDVPSLLESFHIHTGYIGDILQVKQLFQEIILELQLKKPGFRTVIHACFLKLLVLIDRHQGKSPIQHQQDFLIDRLIIHLNQSYHLSWSVKEMAGYCNLSEGYFAHYFKGITGVSPMQYITSLRIDKAKSYLTESTMTVSSIALILGYQDAMYFSRVFKKLTGVSPSEYRKHYLACT